jgi:hypothetical protein
VVAFLKVAIIRDARSVSSLEEKDFSFGLLLGDKLSGSQVGDREEDKECNNNHKVSSFQLAGF